MEYKTLGLILAAGQGSRVSSLLNREEPVKAMLRVGKQRLIDYVIQCTSKLGIDMAVLTYPSPEYKSLDRKVLEDGIKVIKQNVKQRKLPTLLQLPYLLIPLYHFSNERSYLQSFDSIMILPCDIVFERVNLEKMVEFHNSRLKNPNERQLTILSKKGVDDNTYLFKMDGEMVIAMKKYEAVELDGYEASTQAGVYLISKGLLKNPFAILLGFGNNNVYRFLTEGKWTDYGNGY